MTELPPILIAEDSDDDFFFLRRAFRAAAIQNPLLRFRDGSELVNFLNRVPPLAAKDANQEPWLVLVDITMPIMNGFELLEWIGRRKAAPQLRSVVLSGSYRLEDINRARALGASEYIVKPISPATLTALLESAALTK
jgi:CheY-like chemotaxis protein